MSKQPILLLAVALAACGGSDPAEPPGPDSSVVRDGVAYSSDVRILESFPIQLRGSMRIENTGAQPARLELGSGCPVLLRVYRGTGSAPAWDQGNTVVCTMQIEVLSLGPGEVAEEEAPATNAAEILGDSLPDGTYRMATYLRVDGGVIEVPAGQVELAAPR